MSIVPPNAGTPTEFFLQSPPIRHPGFAELFARKLNGGGYRADVQSIPTRTNGDEELMQILSDEFGPDAAAATLELIRIEEANSALFDRVAALRRTVEVAGMLHPE